MSEMEEFLAGIEKQERDFLATLASGPKILARDFLGIGVDIAEHCRMQGLVSRWRSHPRCGQDDNPPFWYVLTAKGKARLAPARPEAPPPTSPTERRFGT